MDKLAICYPVPRDSDEVWEVFKPKVQRFCDTFVRHWSGECATVFAMCCGSDPDHELRRMFQGMSVEFVRYTEGNMDAGSAKFLSKLLPGYFMVNLTSRVYFHRERWLTMLARDRNIYGPGMYGTSASHEGGTFHICTRCWCMDSDILSQYPFECTRNNGTLTEVGMGQENRSLTQWTISQGHTARVVYWDSSEHISTCMAPDNIYRKGSQRNLLVFDKHSDIYRDADEAEKKRLERMCFQGEGGQAS